MKIYSASQLKQWDEFTTEENNRSLQFLVERAASACTVWLLKYYPNHNDYVLYCGPGNNGADGLVIATLLTKNKKNVRVYLLPGAALPGHSEHETKAVLKDSGITMPGPSEPDSLDFIPRNSIVVDAIFGVGLNRPAEGSLANLVNKINELPNLRISVDVPSGMYADKSSLGNVIIKADKTLCLQAYKLAFMMAENSDNIGEAVLLDIGLSSNFNLPSSHEFIDQKSIAKFYRPRPRFSHKGNFGHVHLLAGSYGMMGAAVLAARACMAAGAGKLTCTLPQTGYAIMQASVPEAMCRVSGEHSIQRAGDQNAYNTIAAGPGIGREPQNLSWLREILETDLNLILDADALNLLADNPSLLPALSGRAIITPHPKEFDALFGDSENDFVRLQKACDAARERKIYIILKGHRTAVCDPSGHVSFNSTGNPGMAKAGMGDVLTGITSGLVASGYTLPVASLLGPWLHGTAGDFAAKKFSAEAMQASHVINCLGEAWQRLGKLPSQD